MALLLPLLLFLFCCMSVVSEAGLVAIQGDDMLFKTVSPGGAFIFNGVDILATIASLNDDYQAFKAQIAAQYVLKVL